MRHFLSVSDLNKTEIETVLAWATAVEQQWDHCRSMNNKCVASFFAEPSTRTRFSFERAMHWLGGRVVTAADASSSSSLTKGESLKDCFRTLGQYADLIVMRHKDEDWPKAARKYSRVPVINAGSGSGEHPTQALLDLHTIQQQFKNLDGLKVMFCGDLANGRTVHSLVTLLKLYGVKVVLCPARAGKEVKYLLNLPQEYHDDIFPMDRVNIEDANDALPDMDVIYMTRIQKERFTNHGEAVEFFKLGVDNIGRVKNTAAILHPLPRNEEIAEEIDDDPRAAYHERQVRNGVYVRVALLDYLLYRG